MRGNHPNTAERWQRGVCWPWRQPYTNGPLYRTSLAITYYISGDGDIGGAPAAAAGRVWIF
jgi:hypothetical protein